MPPVDATLDSAGSLTMGASELVGCTTEDGIPAVEPMLDSTGSLISGTTADVGETIVDGSPPVDPTPPALVVGVTIDEGTPAVDPTTGSGAEEMISLELGWAEDGAASLEVDGSGALVVGSTGASGTPPVEPTEGVDGSGTGLGDGVRVGVTTGATDSTLEIDGVGSGCTLDVVGRTGSEGTTLVVPTSALVDG